jgi:hypothetical protein
MAGGKTGGIANPPGVEIEVNRGGEVAPKRARVAVEVVYEVVRHLMDGT